VASRNPPLTTKVSRCDLLPVCPLPIGGSNKSNIEYRKSHKSLNQNELLYATEFRIIDMRFIRRNDFRFPICGAEVGSLDRGIAWHRSIPTPHHKSLALRSFAGMPPPDRGSIKSNIEYRKSHKSLNQNELLYTRVPDD